MIKTIPKSKLRSKEVKAKEPKPLRSSRTAVKKKKETNFDFKIPWKFPFPCEKISARSDTAHSCTGYTCIDPGLDALIVQKTS